MGMSKFLSLRMSVGVCVSVYVDVSVIEIGRERTMNDG
jgi:hypothetical protein